MSAASVGMTRTDLIRVATRINGEMLNGGHDPRREFEVTVELADAGHVLFIVDPKTGTTILREKLRE